MFWSLKCQKNLQDLLSGKYLKKTFVRHNAKNRIGETNFSYSIYKHDTIDIADPSSMQDACHMNFVIDLTHWRVSVA